MGFLLLAAKCLASHIISEYCPNRLAIIPPFVFWFDYIFLLRLVLLSWFLLCRLSDSRLYPGHRVNNVVDTGLSCVCLKNVDIFVLVSCCLGWTISVSWTSARMSIPFVLSLRLLWGCPTHAWFRTQPDTSIEFIHIWGPLLLALSVLRFPSYFPVAVLDLKSALWLPKAEKRRAWGWSFSYCLLLTGMLS